MPIYEYQCETCRHELEALQKISEAPLTRCPECGQEALRKRISAAAFRLKGSGWYETDFKTGDKKNLAGDGQSKEDTGASKDKGAGDSGSGGAKAGQAAATGKASTAGAATAASD
jgi:putative FmdB family regulatory protein